ASEHLVATLSQRVEHRLDVAVDLHLREDLLHLAIGPDDHRRADRADALLAVEDLLAPRAVLFVDLRVRVAEQRKLEVVLRGELAVPLDRVARDAEHDGALLGQLLALRLEALRLARAARRVVLRVEVEDDRLAGEVGERDLAALRAREGERGS